MAVRASSLRSSARRQNTRYCATSVACSRGVCDFNGRAALAAEPTSAPPGSPEKVAILIERARQRRALWHPQDAPMDVESRRLGIR